MSNDQSRDPVPLKRSGLKDSQAEIEALVAKSKRIKSGIEETNRKLDAVIQASDPPSVAEPHAQKSNTAPPKSA